MVTYDELPGLVYWLLIPKKPLQQTMKLRDWKDVSSYMQFISSNFVGVLFRLTAVEKLRVWTLLTQIYLKKVWNMWIFVFREGVSRTLFSSVFPRYFFRIVSKVCHVYIQNIRLVNADVLKMHIAYFWHDLEEIERKNTQKRVLETPSLKTKIPTCLYWKVCFVIYAFYVYHSPTVDKTFVTDWVKTNFSCCSNWGLLSYFKMKIFQKTFCIYHAFQCYFFRNHFSKWLFPCKHFFGQIASIIGLLL